MHMHMGMKRNKRGVDPLVPFNFGSGIGLKSMRGLPRICFRTLDRVDMIPYLQYRGTQFLLHVQLLGVIFGDQINAHIAHWMCKNYGV